MTTTTIESVVPVARNAASIEPNEPSTGIRWSSDGEQWVDLAFDELTSEKLMDIYMQAFGDDGLDEMPPIVPERCPECFMAIGDLEEHHCIRR